MAQQPGVWTAWSHYPRKMRNLTGFWMIELSGESGMPSVPLYQISGFQTCI